MPTRALLYTDRFVDLSAAGFSPATAAERTLAVQVPADPTLWRTGGADAAEAADHVLAVAQQKAAP